MEDLRVRILLRHEQGATIAYLYCREAFELLNIKKQDYDKSQFIEIGNEFTYDSQKYKVVDINFKMEPQLYEMGHGFGINMYSPTDPTDFNCQIGVTVRDIR